MRSQANKDKMGCLLPRRRHEPRAWSLDEAEVYYDWALRAALHPWQMAAVKNAKHSSASCPCLGKGWVLVTDDACIRCPKWLMG